MYLSVLCFILQML